MIKAENGKGKERNILNQGLRRRRNKSGEEKFQRYFESIPVGDRHRTHRKSTRRAGADNRINHHWWLRVASESVAGFSIKRQIT